KDGVYLTPAHIALLDDGQAAPPDVYFAYGHVARVRRASTAPVRRDLLAVASAPDRRWERNLPWSPRYVSLGNEIRFISWSLIFSAFLVVLPGGYLGFLVWKRRFTLSTLLWLPVIAGLFLTFALIKAGMPDSELMYLSRRMLVGLFLCPAVIAATLLAWWTLR